VANFTMDTTLCALCASVVNKPPRNSANFAPLPRIIGTFGVEKKKINAVDDRHSALNHMQLI